MRCYCVEINRTKKEMNLCEYILDRLSQTRTEVDNLSLMMNSSRRILESSYLSIYLYLMIVASDQKQSKSIDRSAETISSIRKKREYLKDILITMQRDDHNYHEEQRRTALLSKDGGRYV